MPFAAMSFGGDSPFLHLSSVDSTCGLYVSIKSKWIPRYQRLFSRSMASPMKETVGIACLTALLLGYNMAWAFLGLISDPDKTL